VWYSPRKYTIGRNMVKPIDITRTVIVPRPSNKKEQLKSFFIGHVDHDVEQKTTEVQVDAKDKITQPHLDNSEIKNTDWKDLY
tara:strand:+ start:222 stop:470 length:249 start_codon:yes stop_codon:yes gene_type:complete